MNIVEELILRIRQGEHGLFRQAVVQWKRDRIARRREQISKRTMVTYFYEAHGVTISRTYDGLGQAVRP